MRAEKFDIASAVCKIAGIRFCLVCKILKYELGDTSAVDTFMSIARIDEKELNRLVDLINSVFSEAKKQPPEKALGVAGERINRVFDCVLELRLKGFLGLEEMIAEAARPIENGNPIAELKEKITEAIKLIREGHLEREGLKDYMDSEISKIYIRRKLKEYERLWEQAKDASVDETVELIYQAIRILEDKRKADWHKSEQNGAIDTVQETNKIIKDSLSEAGVQNADEKSEIHKDLIEVFHKRGILYRGSDDNYNLCLEASKNFKL